jgi:hypothetical protein
MRGSNVKRSGTARWSGCALAFLLSPLILRGGQSLVLTPAVSLNAVDPTLASTQSWRVEFQLHTLGPQPGSYGNKIFYLSGVGLHADIFPDGSINMTDIRDSVEQGTPCRVYTNNLADALIRFQRNLANNQVNCELWNIDGTGYNNQIEPISSVNTSYNGSGGNIGLSITGNLGFLRVFTSVLPLGSRPPTTADHGDWTEWKFDGNLNDSSGHNHNASGPATYVPTPDQIAIALPKTLGAPSWSNWVSLRAGFPAQLDGTSSYSMADASSSVSYFWQQISGPSTVVWSNRTAPTPTITGLIFGTYGFSLKVTDASGNIATVPLQTGAVATDSNGVVVNANPNVDQIYGPMIAFGKSPWGWMDQRALAASTLRAAAYTAQGINPPSWAIPQAGTVNYVFDGATQLGNGGTNLCAPITSTAQMTVTVCSTAKLDLSAFPTRIIVGPTYESQEEIRICSATGNVLSVCYDGRGVAPGSGNDSYRAAAQAWPNGALVGQMKVTGTGTSFTSVLCPAATGVAPFPMGTIAYSTGTVQVHAGLSDAAGIGTSWSIANSVLPGFTIRLQATHGGIPFAFLARINSVNSTNDITMNRVFPADADSGTYTYQIVASDIQLPTLHYARADGSDDQLLWSSNGCESDTQLYLTFSHDIPRLDNSTQTGRQYSFASFNGYSGAFGVNFYGEDLAHRALYYRSGWAPALTAANVMSDQWATSPYNAGGDAGGNPLLLGGGVIGAIASAVIDNRVSWPNLRGFLSQANVPSPGDCNSDDTRDYSYYFSWVALGAQFDPDTSTGGYRSQWQTKLGNIYNWENSCKGADNSWANSGYKFIQASAVNLVHGSKVASGTGYTTGTCPGIAAGTITVTSGSAVATGSGFVNSNKIVIEGTSGGSSFTGFYRFQFNSGGSITLAANWPGDSGTFSYIIENTDGPTQIGTGAGDPQLQKDWGCIYNSPTSLTLSRAWDGPTESAFLSLNNLGYSQQPYMMGIKVNELRWASQVASVNPAGFKTLEGLAATWGNTTGYDPVTQGLFYGRVAQACEPVTIPPASPQFDSRTPGCNNGIQPAYIAEARALIGEGNSMISAYYQSNPTATAKLWADTAYGSVWGYGPLTASGYYSDAYQASNLTDGDLHSYKWTGFFFGMGMAHQWPAARLGGVAPAKIRTVQIGFSPSAGASAKMFVTAPSGAVTSYQCGATPPCAVQVDDRQGAHWLQIQYLSPAGTVASQTDPQLLAAAQ